MLDLEYRHVDVFSRRALRGNGLVVVLNAASLPAAVMQEVTREVRQFETAFVTDVDLAGGPTRLRIFTEDEELGSAGHPVVGAAAVLHTLLPASDGEQAWALTLTQRTVQARTRSAAGWIDAAMDQGRPGAAPSRTLPLRVFPGVVAVPMLPWSAGLADTEPGRCSGRLPGRLEQGGEFVAFGRADRDVSVYQRGEQHVQGLGPFARAGSMEDVEAGLPVQPLGERFR